MGDSIDPSELLDPPGVRSDVGFLSAEDIRKGATDLFVETDFYIGPNISFTGTTTENPNNTAYQMYLSGFLGQLGTVIAQNETDGVWFRSQPEFDDQRQQVKVLARVTVPPLTVLEDLVEDIMRIQEEQGPLGQKSVLGTVICSHLAEIVNEALAEENLGARACAEKWGAIYVAAT